jgi:hypothetical protein
MKKLWMAAIVMMAAVSFPYAADAQPYGQEWEFSLGGSGSSNRDFDATVFSTELSLGYFFSDHFEALIRQGIGVSDTQHNDSQWNGATRFGLDFHFEFIRETWAYVGGAIGYIYGDSVESTYVAGPEGGIKIFVNDTTFINTMVAYEFLFEDSDEVDAAYEDGRFVYVLSIGFRF